MVKLTKIYTRGGDKGETSLGNGARVSKHALRVETFGTVDETNAAIGLARLHTSGETDAMLARIQHDLFDVGADLCTPQGADDRNALRIQTSQVARLEAEIDRMNATLSDLESFVLPGGSSAGAFLHQARTVCRRAERLITALMEHEALNEQVLMYMNRLSDHLFVLARTANDNGAMDVLWQPGVNR